MQMKVALQVLSNWKFHYFEVQLDMGKLCLMSANRHGVVPARRLERNIKKILRLAVYEKFARRSVLRAKYRVIVNGIIGKINILI